MEVQDNSYVIFENAKILYAYHNAAKQLESIAKKDVTANKALTWLQSKIEEYIKEIIILGGKVVLGSDALGGSGPVVKYQNGSVIEYEVGAVEAEKFISTFREKF